MTIASSKLLTYSMCRKSEVLRARWREFDLDKAQWGIPASSRSLKETFYLPSRSAVNSAVNYIDIGDRAHTETGRG